MSAAWDIVITMVGICRDLFLGMKYFFEFDWMDAGRMDDLKISRKLYEISVL